MQVRKAIVTSGQTMQDIAVQYCGSLSALATLAALNNLALTAEVTAGQELILPDIAEKRVEAVFRAGRYYPAAGNNTTEGLDGISYWGIEFDFIVS